MNAVEHILGAAALARHGERAALVCGDETVSYTDLAARVARASAAIRSLGVRPGERVLLLLRDTPEFAVAWLGAVRAGAVVIGLNTKLSEQEYRHIREDSAARLAIIEDVFAQARPDLTAELAREGRLAVAGTQVPAGGASWRDVVALAPANAPAFDAAPEQPAFWLYSSGTTGKPKGIVHTHKNLLPAGQAQREILGLQVGDTVFATSKLFFSYSLENGFLGPLSIGATSILNPEWADTGPVLELVARHRPKAFFSVPSFYRRLLALPAEQLAPFRAVSYFVAAGERLPAQMIEQWRAAVGGEILNLYGMSETFCVCMMTPRGASTGSRTGKPLTGIETRLLDSTGAEVGPGEPGVLWVRHPALALGYANRPDASREQFVDGWFCTRDVFVREADGYYVHQGRSDEFIKVAGQWVQPGELEEVVLGNDAIVEAACVPVVDADGFERLALFVAPRADAQAAAGAAAHACEERLPRHKRPKWIRPVAELPRTATGKVQRFKLREMLERELRGNG
jgi:benzoate-CoA ligase